MINPGLLSVLMCGGGAPPPPPPSPPADVADVTLKKKGVAAKEKLGKKTRSKAALKETAGPTGLNIGKLCVNQ